jgi:hypothetical protein
VLDGQHISLGCVGRLSVLAGEVVNVAGRPDSRARSRQYARRFTLSLLIAALSLSSAGCSSADQSTAPESGSDIGLQVEPNRAEAGQLVDLAVVGPGSDEAARGSVSYFEVRDAAGKWRRRYALNTDLPGDPATVRPLGAHLGVGLRPDTDDRVKIPDVEPGRYRISKRIVISEDSVETVTGSVRVSD